MSLATESPFEQAMTLLRKTEKQLRVLLGQAAQDGEYDEVAKIANCARELKKHVEGLVSPPEGRKVRETARVNNSEGYPKFFRDGNKLVMVGWSKKSSTEYTHIAPRVALDLLVEKLVEACETKETIPANELLPLANPESGEDFPDYYARTFLRWLRTIGIAKKDGHRGYHIRTELGYQSIIQSRWNRLATRS